MPDSHDYTDALLTIGRNNPWIRRAYDPPFTREQFAHCTDLPALVARVYVGNWCLGATFICGEVAVMNQVDGGHEWLVCLRGQAVESFSHRIADEFLAALLREIALGART